MTINPAQTGLTVHNLLQSASQQLAARPDIDAALEASILLAHLLGKDRSWLYAWPEYLPERSQLQTYQTMITRRIQGEPVSYITGSREFWGLKFKVNTNTLIPRPETELLVETALRLIKPRNADILELGTGSGAIAAALATERPGWNILATDSNEETLAVARHNLDQLAPAVITRASHWFANLGGAQFDLIISNPPYIEEDDAHLQMGDLRFEPRSALVSGVDGLEDIRHIIKQARQFLKPDGFLMLEHGYNQGRSVQQLFIDAAMMNIQTIRDLSGHDRITLGQPHKNP